MKLLIDADGCPVIDEALSIARQAGLEVVLLCDTSHEFQRQGAKTITVSKGADSVDFALVNLICPGDFVVTQDYGLAAMCLAKRARVINQNGLVYTDETIDSMLLARYTAQKIRSGGGRLKGPKKRTSAQDAAFRRAFSQLIAID